MAALTGHRPRKAGLAFADNKGLRGRLHRPARAHPGKRKQPINQRSALDVDRRVLQSQIHRVFENFDGAHVGIRDIHHPQNGQDPDLPLRLLIAGKVGA
jgi:hypothetical protein